MNKGRRKVSDLIARCGVAAALVLVSVQPVLAQSASDFRLQPGSSSPTPRPAGPVDPDVPGSTPTPQRTASPPPPPPAASAAPAATATPPASGASTGARPATGPTATQPARRGSFTPAPVPPAASGSPAGAAASSPAPGFPPPTLPNTSAAPLAPGTAPLSVDRGGFAWWWLVPPAIIAAALALLFVGRRRRASPERTEGERPEQPAVGASPPPQLGKRPQQPARPVAKAESPAPEPTIAIAQPGEALALALVATRLSATLVNTTLSYRLVVENCSDSALGPVLVAGDMIGAHGAVPVEQQLATDGQPLELRHEIARIEPGERIELSGELRLPLAQINPIRSGAIALFVPLARFRAEATGATTLATFVVGELQQTSASAALLPFRLDLGPRIYSQVSQRRIDPLAA